MYELDSIYEGLYEYYVNDYIIFEGVLRRDYYECIGILNEDGNKNFLQKIYERIKQALIKLKDKIKELFTKIRDKMLYDNEKKLKTIWYIYTNYYDKENGELNEFTMKNFKPFKLINPTEIEKEFDMDFTFKILKIQNDDKDIEELQDKVNNIDKLKEDIHNKIWIDKEIKYPFKEINGLKKYIENKPLKTVKTFVKVIDDIDKYYEKEMEQKIKKLEKNIKEYEEETKKDKDDIYYNYKLKNAQNNLKAVNLVGTLLPNIITTLIMEFQNLFRESIKLYIAGGKYLKKTIKGSNIEENDKNEEEDLYNKYKISSTFIDKVKDGNKRTVRIMVQDSLLVDLSFKQADAMLQYAAKYMDDLYDEHDNRDFELDKTKWDKDYLSKVMTKVLYNFSKERINHLKNVINHVYKEEKSSQKESHISNEYINALSEATIYELYLE